MACSARRSTALVAALLAACLSQGCATGHLIDSARVDERVAHIRQAWTDGERLYVRYTASLTTEQGRPLGTAERTASVDLSALRAAARAPARALPVRWLADDGDGTGRDWRALPLRPPRPGEDGRADGRDGALHADGNGRDGHRVDDARLARGRRTPAVAGAAPALVVYAGDHGGPPAAFALADGRPPVEIPVDALSRGSTASWVWPLVPFTVVFDVFTTPVMVFFAIPLVALGD